MEEKHKPVHEVKIGVIKAAIWEYQNASGVWHNVTISRVYDEGQACRDLLCLGRDDLLVVAKAADLAHTWIVENQKREPTE